MAENKKEKSLDIITSALKDLGDIQREEGESNSLKLRPNFYSAPFKFTVYKITRPPSRGAHESRIQISWSQEKYAVKNFWTQDGHLSYFVGIDLTHKPVFVFWCADDFDPKWSANVQVQTHTIESARKNGIAFEEKKLKKTDRNINIVACSESYLKEALIRLAVLRLHSHF